jgi:hypothetical protein
MGARGFVPSGGSRRPRASFPSLPPRRLVVADGPRREQPLDHDEPMRPRIEQPRPAPPWRLPALHPQVAFHPSLARGSRRGRKKAGGADEVPKAVELRCRIDDTACRSFPSTMLSDARPKNSPLNCCSPFPSHPLTLRAQIHARATASDLLRLLATASRVSRHGRPPSCDRAVSRRVLERGGGGKARILRVGRAAAAYGASRAKQRCAVARDEQHDE